MSRRASGAVPAPLHPRETDRLAVLRSYNVLDTLPEAAFDDIAFLASVICQTPIALVSLVDRSRQWFKARVGTDIEETSREVAFCAHAILQPDEMLVVPDTHDDPRFATNPLVTDAPGVRFYAGVPLNSPQGLPLGTLCTFDSVPRRLTAEQARALAALSREVMVHLELRRTIAELATELGDEGLPGTGLNGEVEDAGRAAARASTLVAEALEQVLEAEGRLRDLVHRMRTIQRQAPPRWPA
jgi:two-component system, NtrC family, sensor kinase